MGGRALGSNTTLAGGFEPAYGTPPDTTVGNWLELAFSSSQMGEERPLIASDLLGQGREPQDPTSDVATNTGDIVVPVDVRLFWIWLRLMFGDPVGSAATASGSIVFSGQSPDPNSTVTINGVVFTFVSGTPTGNQVKRSTTIATTVAALATALNASTDPNVSKATYTATDHTLNVTFDTSGTSGNAFTLAASSNSNGRPMTPTLVGGGKRWTFTSGAASLPSMALELAHPEIPNYEMHYGVLGNMLKIGMNRSGLLSATISCIAQGEADPNPISSVGVPSTFQIDRFAQATGQITQDGVVLGQVVSAEFTFSNNLDPVETIRADGRIAGADPGMVGMTGKLTIKYSDTVLQQKASDGTPVQLSFGWTKGAASLAFTIPRVFLPRAKHPVTGPKGIQADYNFQASGAQGASCTAVLINDVSVYSTYIALPTETFSDEVPAVPNGAEIQVPGGGGGDGGTDDGSGGGGTEETGTGGDGTGGSTS